MSETIPTVGRVPVLGSALEIGRDPFDFWRAPEEYGPVFRVSIPGLSFVCYTDAELVERVLAGKADRYRKDPRRSTSSATCSVTACSPPAATTGSAAASTSSPRSIRVGSASMVRMLDRTADELERWDDGEVIDVHGRRRD